VQWGYRLLGLQILLMPGLHIVQELTVRLGIYFVARTARPDMRELLSGSLDIAYGDKDCLDLAAANIGSVAMP
jgi:hypothetical protein